MDMNLILFTTGGVVVGFVAGALVMFFIFKNNIKFFNKTKASLEAKAAKLEAQAKDILDKIRA